MWSVLSYFYASPIFAVPADLGSCNITLSYNQSTGRLQYITSSWNSIPVSQSTCWAKARKYPVSRLLPKLICCKYHYCKVDSTCALVVEWGIVYFVLAWCHQSFAYLQQPTWCSQNMKDNYLKTIQSVLVSYCACILTYLPPALNSPQLVG